MWKQTKLAWCKHSISSFRSLRRQPKTTVSGPNSSSFKKADSPPLPGDYWIKPHTSWKSSRRSTSSNTNKRSCKSGNRQSGNLNKSAAPKPLKKKNIISHKMYNKS
ncbi:hypothetical protein RclHR1_00320010 [Rhizophagus clarus]|uniref:Uncharacterized protein n=1 Tax=Rhizophagus clarus TaxID=94130 RepID=A0A2Z6R817_9GLOM|nr:hypothetical protein RclHR1_00320010 [Rhizophagus clarus]